MLTYCSENWNLHPDSWAPPNLSLCHDTYSQSFEAIGPLPPWHLHQVESYHLISFTDVKRGKISLSYSGLILFCAAPSTPLHNSLPPAGIPEQEQEHTHASVLCWIGLEPGEIHIHRNFSIQFCLPAPRQPCFNLLQYIWLLSFPWCLQ